MKLAGVILCGGASRRMGTAKAALRFGEETMLARVARLLATVTDQIVLVAAVGQTLPPVPIEARVVFDQRPDRGPLEGMLAGLKGVADDCDATYVTSCDVPLLVPAFVTRVAELLGTHEIAVPRINGFLHPLAAVYRPRVAAVITQLLDQEQLRLTGLFERVATRIITSNELADIDPTFATLKNLNTPDDYRKAME